MIEREQLKAVLNTLLQPEHFKDYCPNGLQVEGRQKITRIMTGVTASQALIDKAVSLDVDAIVVHHGLFWRGDDPCCTGILKKRLHTLLDHDINLFAYHLPLDCHLTLGNNVQLANLCGWEVMGSLPDRGVPDLLWQGRLSQAATAGEFAAQLAQALGREPQHFGPEDKSITRLAWCTGGAQKMLVQAAQLGVDAFVTGEVSESCFHLAQEYGVHFFAAGHHATERYGVKALGEWLQNDPQLARDYQLSCQFIDIDNPV